MTNLIRANLTAQLMLCGFLIRAAWHTADAVAGVYRGIGRQGNVCMGLLDGAMTRRWDRLNARLARIDGRAVQQAGDRVLAAVLIIAGALCAALFASDLFAMLGGAR